MEGAERLQGLSMFEQGSGKVSLAGSKRVLESYRPRASTIPASLDLTDCPFMWPYCKQPLCVVGRLWLLCTPLGCYEIAKFELCFEVVLT